MRSPEFLSCVYVIRKYDVLFGNPFKTKNNMLLKPRQQRSDGKINVETSTSSPDVIMLDNMDAVFSIESPEQNNIGALNNDQAESDYIALFADTPRPDYYNTSLETISGVTNKTAYRKGDDEVFIERLARTRPPLANASTSKFKINYDTNIDVHPKAVAMPTIDSKSVAVDPSSVASYRSLENTPWEKRFSQKYKRDYWFNELTGISSWTPPEESK